MSQVQVPVDQLIYSLEENLQRQFASYQDETARNIESRIESMFTLLTDKLLSRFPPSVPVDCSGSGTTDTSPVEPQPADASGGENQEEQVPKGSYSKSSVPGGPAPPRGSTGDSNPFPGDSRHNPSLLNLD